MKELIDTLHGWEAEGHTAARAVVVRTFGSAPRPEGAVGLKWYSVETGKWIESDIPSPPGHGHRISGLAGPIAEFLQGRRPPIATAEEGRTALRMVLACYVSSDEGRRVRLDDPAVARV